MTSAPVEAFLAFLRDCEQRYHMAEADEQEANAPTNDIHHSLELLGEVRKAERAAENRIYTPRVRKAL